MSDLERILDTVDSQHGKPTLITPDNGLNMYVHDTNPLTAYQKLLANDDRMDNIWVNYAPCRACTLALEHRFRTQENKPTIYVSQVSIDTNSLEEVIETLKCLGKIQHLGFNIVAWNFEQFKTILTEPCQMLITERTGERDFMNAYMRVERIVAFIRQLGENPHANSWCQPEQFRPSPL